MILKKKEKEYLKNIYFGEFCQKPKSVPNPCTYYSSCSHLCYKLCTLCVKERKKEVNIEINSVHSPMLIAYWVIIILFVIIDESIQYRIYVRYSPDYLVLHTMQCIRRYVWPADYLVLSGALGKPCTSVMYS